jgi:hypothetical protein
MKRVILLCSAALLVAAVSTDAQSALRVTAQPSYESYSFSTPDAEPYYQDISQLSVPIGVFVPIGRSLDLALSGGYANVRMTGTDASDRYNDLDVSGLLDTQFRLSWQVVPRRVVLFATGVAPTGIKTLDQQEELNMLAWLASDVMGFQAPVLGTGGSAGGGFGAALPMGQSWSFGVGGSARMRFGYIPVEGLVDQNINPSEVVEITPGTDVRLRLGVEGAAARNTYLRISAMFATQTNDKVIDSTANKVGNRFIGYVSLNQRIGNGSFVLYGFDIYRTDPEFVGVGALLPPGNLLGGGARYEARLSPTLQLTPRVEFRTSQQVYAPPSGAEPPADAPQRKGGHSIRFGADLSYELSPGLNVVVRGSGLTGMLRRNVFETELNDYASGLVVQEIDVSGWRAGIHLEWRP